MSTDHHRTPPTNNEGRTTILDLEPLITLLKKPAMADVYLTALNTDVTVPELLETVELTKSTVYDYVESLQDAGLMTETGEKNGATAYTANEFTFTLEVDGAKIEVTSDIVAVLAQQDSAPEIQGFVDQYGIATLAAFIDFAYEQARGDITTRMIADQLQISRGSAFDMLEHTHRILEIEDEPETYHPDDISDSERDELLDRSSQS